MKNIISVFLGCALFLSGGVFADDLVKKTDSFSMGSAGKPVAFNMAVAVEGGACYGSGEIGISAASLILSCQSGRWVAPSAEGSWGGSYFYSPGHGGCYVRNPITGGCSCPANFSVYNAFSIAVGGCYPCTLYQCAKK